jgi:hypothetical protein
MADIVNNVRMSLDWSDIKHGFMAFTLADGQSDGTIYDTRDDAIRHHRNKASRYFYFSLREAAHGITSREAAQVIALTRVQAERGRYHPEANLAPINPITMEDVISELMQ